MNTASTLKLMVRPRNRRATMLIQEGDGMVNYSGGETADVERVEAIQS